MKPIVEIEHDDAGGMHSMYLRYSEAPVARTVARDPEGSVNVDLAADGSPVGVELVSTGDEEVSLAIAAAQEYGLSLVGVFNPTNVRQVS